MNKIDIDNHPANEIPKELITDEEIDARILSLQEKFDKIPASRLSVENIREEIEFLAHQWRLRNNLYQIHSHRKFLGKILVTFRSLVHGETRRYIDPVISQQNEINFAVSSLMGHIMNQLSELIERMNIIEGENQRLKEEIKRLKREKIEE